MEFYANRVTLKCLSSLLSSLRNLCLSEGNSHRNFDSELVQMTDFNTSASITSSRSKVTMSIALSTSHALICESTILKPVLTSDPSEMSKHRFTDYWRRWKIPSEEVPSDFIIFFRGRLKQKSRLDAIFCLLLWTRISVTIISHLTQLHMLSILLHWIRPVKMKFLKNKFIEKLPMRNWRITDT